MDANKQAYWWWFDSHNNTPKYSPWLRSTLAEVDEKAKAMLKLIEQDADSFAQRAEMYYKKRPELISMVEDLYRTYRSLAERYDQHRMDPRTRVRSPLRHSLPDFKAEFGVSSVKSLGSFIEEAYNSCEDESSAESEVDDPEDDDHDTVVVGDEDEEGIENHQFKSCDELIKLREDIKRLREENEIHNNLMKQKEKESEMLKKEMEYLMIESMKFKKQMCEKEAEKIETAIQFEEVKNVLMKTKKEIDESLAEKDEEKREVIRQLSLGMEMLREENQLLKKKLIMKNTPKKQEFQIFKGLGLGTLFGLSSPKYSASVVPLKLKQK